MTAPVAEAYFVEQLRARFESDGFEFNALPSSEALPDFMGRYRPDAVATRGDQKIAIEIRGPRTAAAELSLPQISRLFEGHSNWRLRVIHMGIGLGEAAKISRSAPEAIRSGAALARGLRDGKENRLAFVSAWSLLEAAYRSTADNDGSEPYDPATVVQTIAMNGAISPEAEKGLQTLVPLRDRIVHGDLDAQPTEDQVDLVLSAIDDVLRRVPSSRA